MNSEGGGEGRGGRGGREEGGRGEGDSVASCTEGNASDKIYSTEVQRTLYHTEGAKSTSTTWSHLQFHCRRNGNETMILRAVLVTDHCSS